MTISEPESLRQQLRQAVYDCRERGLTEAAKWAAQQLMGLPKQDEAEKQQEPACTSDSGESDVYLYAKTLFDDKVCCRRKRVHSDTVFLSHASQYAPALAVCC